MPTEGDEQWLPWDCWQSPLELTLKEPQIVTNWHLLTWFSKWHSPSAMALLMIFIVYEFHLYWHTLPKSLTILLSMQQCRFQVSKYKLINYQNWWSKSLQEIVKISCQFQDNFSMRKRRCTVFTLKRGNQFGLYLRERQDMLCFAINNI